MNTPEEEKLVLDVVRVAARKAGMTPYEWVLSVAIGGGKRGRKPASPAAPSAEDEKVPDEVILAELRKLYAEDSQVRAGAWAKACDGLISKAGFYARLDRLVAEKKVLVEAARMPGKFYGREMMMNVKLYHDPEMLLENDGASYAELAGVTIAEVKALLAAKGGAS